MTGLSKESPVVHSGVDGDEPIQRSSFPVLARDFVNARHGATILWTRNGIRFAGSYSVRNFAELSKIRRICGSVAVAQRASMYSPANITSPLKNDAKKLKVAAPTIAARKKSFRSAPQIVRGLLIDLGTR